MKKFEERVKYIITNILGGYKAVAEKLNLSSQAVRDYASGKSFPRQDFLEFVIAQNISINWLLSGKGEMLIEPNDAIAEPETIYLVAGEIQSRTKDHILSEQLARIQQLLKTNMPAEAKKFFIESTLLKIRELEDAP